MNYSTSYTCGRLVVIALSVLLLVSCDHSRLYETNFDVAQEQWTYSDTKTYTVSVLDTTQRYHIYINVRHSFNFEWRNMYVRIVTTLPNGQKMDKRVNLPLCEADGKWFGSCIGDNCDLPIMIQHDARFPSIGRYTFSITQDMRVNPLRGIKSVGLRIVKADISTPEKR